LRGKLKSSRRGMGGEFRSFEKDDGKLSRGNARAADHSGDEGGEDTQGKFRLRWGTIRETSEKNS